MIDIPLKSADEYDALTNARKFYIWRAGDIKKIKRRYSKRRRRYYKRLIEEELKQLD